MEKLRIKIEKAVTTEELKDLLYHYRQKLYKEGTKENSILRHLDDTFWYLDLDTLDKQKENINKLLTFYGY